MYYDPWRSWLYKTLTLIPDVKGTLLVYGIKISFTLIHNISYNQMKFHLSLFCSFSLMYVQTVRLTKISSQQKLFNIHIWFYYNLIICIYSAFFCILPYMNQQDDRTHFPSFLVTVTITLVNNRTVLVNGCSAKCYLLGAPKSQHFSTRDTNTKWVKWGDTVTRCCQLQMLQCFSGFLE